jgi:hypothetical protein
LPPEAVCSAPKVVGKLFEKVLFEKVYPDADGDSITNTGGYLVGVDTGVVKNSAMSLAEVDAPGKTDKPSASEISFSVF